jgi:DNA (cytosine-5)-methyltransferase 1
VRVKQVTFVDLFSGAGGLAEGFRLASDDALQFKSVFAVEVDESAAATYQRNFGHRVFTKSIERLKRNDVPKVDLVIGGPPCQGFSPLGQMSPSEAHSRMNKLWKYFFRVVFWLQPEAFVVENVPEFLKSAEFSAVLKRARELKYEIDFGVLNALHFDVPQARRRGFLIGHRMRQPVLPTPKIQLPRTVRSAIGDIRNVPLRYEFESGRTFRDLPELCGNELHLGRTPTTISLERYRVIPPGGNRFNLMRERPDLTPDCWMNKPTGSTDVMGRLEWDKPSLTIRTEFYKPEKGRYLHPEFDRPITHLEAARLQTFPDTFSFCGSKIQIARQIGNAVPPVLARGVAEAVKDLFLGRAATTAPRHLAEQLSLPRLVRVG